MQKRHPDKLVWEAIGRTVAVRIPLLVNQQSIAQHAEFARNWDGL